MRVRDRFEVRVRISSKIRVCDCSIYKVHGNKIELCMRFFITLNTMIKSGS